jgi:outer membrane immunogenic protein
LVLGVEADFQGTSQTNTQNFGCGFDCVLTEDIKIPWFATFGARAGVAFDRILVYGTGGVAWLDASDNLTAAAGGISATLLNLSNSQAGWTAGAGIEVAFAENWTARIEYLFMDVSPSFTGTAPAAIGGGTITENGTIKDSIVRAAINFKFTPTF